jgi:hypothetical protein
MSVGSALRSAMTKVGNSNSSTTTRHPAASDRRYLAAWALVHPVIESSTITSRLQLRFRRKRVRTSNTSYQGGFEMAGIVGELLSIIAKRCPR